MKKNTTLLLSILLSLSAFSQLQFNFTDKITIPHTSIKSQYRSGTCWTFATNSFIESEIMREKNITLDLSEMFSAYHTYHDRAILFVRYHGHLNFSGGAQSWDVLECVKKHGLITEEAYNGIEYDEPNHVHGEMDFVLKSFVNGVIENKNKKLTPVWINAFDGILDAYLGEIPEQFNFNNKSYTPIEFRDFLKFNPDNYVALASFNHHEYYSEYVFESPDNWANKTVINIPLKDLTQIIDHALENGYSVQWSSDVSEKGFEHDKGYAVLLDETNPDIFNEPEVTEELRLNHFNSYQTTDDHAMHIIGTAVDSNGNEYYKVKNSWGQGNVYEGYFYVSKNYVNLKTMTILLHKEGIPENILKKIL